MKNKSITIILLLLSIVLATNSSFSQTLTPHGHYWWWCFNMRGHMFSTQICAQRRENCVNTLNEIRRENPRRISRHERCVHVFQ